MNVRRLLWVLTACCAELWAGQPVWLHLLNGDRIPGIYQGQDGEAVVLETGRERLRIQGKMIDRLDFGRKPVAAEGEVQLQLSANEYIRGTILDLSGETLKLKTRWADPLVMDPGFVRRVESVNAGNQVLYRGPDEMEKWSILSGNRTRTRPQPRRISGREDRWVFKTEGEISRNFPPVSKGLTVKLRLELPELSGGERVSVVLENLPGMQGSGRNRSGQLRVVVDARTLRVEEVPLLVANGVVFGQRKIIRGSMTRPPAGEVEIVIEYDRVHQRYRVRIGNRVLGEWQAAEPGREVGSYRPGLGFEWLLGDASFSVNEILLVESENSLPENSLQFPEDEQVILFQNSDFLKVRWEGLDAEGNWKLLLKDTGTRTTMDPARIQFWLNQGKTLKTVRRTASQVEVRLSGEGEVFLAELLEADASSLHIRREGWEGTHRIPLELVEHVRFNPYFNGE